MFLLPKLLTLGISFSTGVNAVVVAETRYFILYFSNFSIIICFCNKTTSIRHFLSAPLIFFSKANLAILYLVFKTNPKVSTLFTFTTNWLYVVVFFYVWQKRDFLDIFCKTIYEDDITWTIPSLNFSFVDKRLKTSNLFAWARKHYCMLNYKSLKLGAFMDKIIPIGKWRENSICDNVFSIKVLSKKFGTGKHSCICYLRN